MPDYLNLSWDQLNNDTVELAQNLQKLNQKWTILVAIARGGLVPAAIIANQLSIRWVDTVCINSYDDENFQQHEMEILKDLRSESHNILVIDDLVDTGKTYNLVRTMLPNAYFSSVYAKPEGKASTDMFLKEIPQNKWVVFPWEESPETLFETA